jgi:ATP-binding cassette subfamily B multidrug efflux pump
MAIADAHSWLGGLRTLWRMTRIAFLTPWQVTFAVLATLISAGMQLMIPRLLGRAIDQTQLLAAGDANAARSALMVTALLVLLVSAVRGIFTTFQNYFSEAVNHTTGVELRLRYYEQVQRLSFGFHDSVHSGDLITLGLLDLDGARQFFSTGLVRLVLLTVLIGFGGTMLIRTDPLLGLMALSFVPIVGWFSSVSQLRLRLTWRDLQDRMSVLSRVMEENLAGIRVVRAFSAGAHEMEKFDAASASALGLAHERVDIRVRSTGIMTLSFLGAMGLVLWVGGEKVMGGTMSVGTLTSFLTFMTILQMPVRQLGLLVNSFARTSTCGARVFAFLDMQPAISDAQDARDLVLTDDELRFEGVDFSYPNAPETKVLSGLTFTARKGETIGIIGPPGSGKSTLSHLIPRFYDGAAGRITIDGQDIRNLTLSSLRRAVSVVAQDVFLFTTSLENNIAYAEPGAEDEDIEQASTDAQIHSHIAGLKSGYRTVVGERGSSLSGGQRQRVSIARSLVPNPAVLIFDDSTAAVDANTEGRIRLALAEGAADRVTLIVAHRLNSLLHADRILFLDKGQVVEQGSHAELLALGGRYRALYDLQTNGADREGLCPIRPPTPTTSPTANPLRGRRHCAP